MLSPVEGAFHDGAGHTDASFHALAIAGVERLSMPGDQLRLVVVQVALAGSARHEQLNHAAHFSRMMQATVESGVRRHRAGQQAILAHKDASANPAKPDSKSRRVG